MTSLFCTTYPGTLQLPYQACIRVHMNSDMNQFREVETNITKLSNTLNLIIYYVRSRAR